ncbi:probable serine hydrolase [Stomoxys calcitrans]|uniref:AB hydrolase-1 domain-containing protein n=1 Tax=Stomoxys calcitrans TaxID=35570 RepID=A0A1I8NPR3_STOCA|nr:probable serine hydrolase [Stomoxys calcitrans]
MHEEIRIPIGLGYIAGRWYGNRNERPILALHGWQDNAGSFALLAPLLSRQVAILAIDLPGHGRSFHNPPGVMYRTMDYIRAVKEVAGHFKWPKVSLLSHSMGTSIAYMFAALYPQLVDVMVNIDIVHCRYHPLEWQIKALAYTTDKYVVEIERKLAKNGKKPPTYKFENLEKLLHEGSGQSIDIEKTKYVLERNIAAVNPGVEDEFYFSRDGAIKYFQEFNTEPGLCIAMAKRMLNIKWLILKAKDSEHINEDSSLTQEVLQILKSNNPVFAYHVVPNAKHHCHLNNADRVADYISPFLAKHRPPEILNVENKL